MDTAIYKPLSKDFFLSRYPFTWPLKIYVRNVDEDESKGYSEFTGPGGHHVGEYGYPLYFRDLGTELDAFRQRLKTLPEALNASENVCIVADGCRTAERDLSILREIVAQHFT